MTLIQIVCLKLTPWNLIYWEKIVGVTQVDHSLPTFTFFKRHPKTPNSEIVYLV